MKAFDDVMHYIKIPTVNDNPLRSWHDTCAHQGDLSPSELLLRALSKPR